MLLWFARKGHKLDFWLRQLFFTVFLHIRLELKDFLLSSEFIEDCSEQRVYPSGTGNSIALLFSSTSLPPPNF